MAVYLVEIADTVEPIEVKAQQKELNILINQHYGGNTKVHFKSCGTINELRDLERSLHRKN